MQFLTRAPGRREAVPVPRPRPFGSLPSIPPEMFQQPERQDPNVEYGSPEHEMLRDIGVERLKQRMWRNLGVDYQSSGRFNDSRTPLEGMRMRPSYDWLKDLEFMIEGNMAKEPEAASRFPGEDKKTRIGLGESLEPQRRKEK